MKKIGKFLRILCGCHGRADRSFFYKGRQFPVCARCTGELIGIAAGIITVILYGCIQDRFIPVLMIPLVCDGTVQLLTSYESTNARRILTGLLFGFSLVFAFLWFHRHCVYVAEWVVNLFLEDPEKIKWIEDSMVIMPK